MPNDPAERSPDDRPGKLPARAVCLVLVLMVAAAGCARPDDWLQTYPDIAARARQDPVSFWLAAHGQWDELAGMWGSYQVRASRGINSRRLDTQIYLYRDRFFQLEALSPAGSTEGYLVAGAAEVGFWTSEENVLYRGDLAPGAFGLALGLDLEPRDIVAVLIGYALAGPPEAAEASWDDAERRIRIVADGGRVTAWLHPVSGRVERVALVTRSGPIEVDYGAVADEPAPVPLELTIRVPREEATLRLRLAATWEADPAGLDERFFDLIVPVGAALQPLERLTVEGGLLRRGLER